MLVNSVMNRFYSVLTQGAVILDYILSVVKIPLNF